MGFGDTRSLTAHRFELVEEAQLLVSARQSQSHIHFDLGMFLPASGGVPLFFSEHP